MTHYRYLILGGGIVAGYAAKEFVQHGVGAGEVGIVSADDRLPYERPPLSKDYIQGETTLDEILINEAEFYQQHGIGVHLNTQIERVSFETHALTADDGREFTFEMLLIATGSSPNTLSVPGADLPEVFYLREDDDARQILALAERFSRAVVVGGSYIGMEVSASLQQQGLDVALIYRENRLMEQRFFTQTLSQFFERYFEERGVTLIAGREVAEIVGDGGHVAGVVLDNGEEWPTDFLVAGIGVQPNLDLFKDTGLLVKGGIVVNAFLESNFEGVYAAGDVAFYADELYETRRMVGHWDNAVHQGQVAARNMLAAFHKTGASEKYLHVPYFFSDLFDLSYEFWGDKSAADRVVYRGFMQDNSFSVWWLEGEQVVAAFILGRPAEESDLAARWVRERQAVSPDILGDDTRALAEAERAFEA